MFDMPDDDLPGDQGQHGDQGQDGVEVPVSPWYQLGQQIGKQMAADLEAALTPMPPKLRSKSKAARRLTDHLRSMDYEFTPAQRLMREEMTSSGESALSAEEVEQAVTYLIENADPGLKLGAGEWHAVRALVAAGVRLGRDL